MEPIKFKNYLIEFDEFDDDVVDVYIDGIKVLRKYQSQNWTYFYQHITIDKYQQFTHDVRKNPELRDFYTNYLRYN